MENILFFCPGDRKTPILQRRIIIPKRVVAPFIGFLFALVAAGVCVSAEQISLFRDTYGVPHIYSGSNEGVMFGLGYAQAEDDLEGVIENYIRAAGRLSEFFGIDDPTYPGSDSRYLAQDLQARLCRVKMTVVERYGTLDGPTRSMVEAFAAGVNAYVDEQNGLLPDWILAVTPVSGVDVVALTRWNQWDREFDVARDELRNLYTAPSRSNQWAIGRSKSASGNVLVEIDPHTSWHTRSRYYEAHIVGGDYNFSGAAALGLPVFYHGHSDVYAGAITANSVDMADVYIETLNQANDSYLFDGDWYPVTTEVEKIDVLGVGSFPVTFRYTHGGQRMVVKWDEANHRALAVRLVSGSEIATIEQSLQMMAARSLTEFKQAMSMQHASSGNFMYGDVDGNIFYVYNARQPQKSPLYNWNAPVDGSTSATEWGALIAFDDLPQVENPESGYLINNNVAPWYVTDGSGIDGDDYPFYLFRHDPDGSGGAGFGLRQRRALGLIHPRDDITVADMRDFAFDHYLIAAEWVKILLAESMNDPAARQSVADPLNLLEPAFELLHGWDNFAVKQSTAMTLFSLYYSLFPTSLTALEPPDPGNLTVANKVDLLNGLVNAAGSLSSYYGTLHVPWGAVHKISRGPLAYPVNGGCKKSQALRLANISRIENGVGFCEGGSAFIMIVELSQPVRAFSAKPYGQSEDPSSPHFDDLTKLYCNDQLKPAWFTLTDVMDNLESTTLLYY